MHIPFSLTLLTLFTSSTFAAVCEVNSDNCRAVINASSCFNKYMTGTNVNNILSCLTGTEGTATNKEKVFKPRLSGICLCVSIVLIPDADVLLYCMRRTCYDKLLDQEQGVLDLGGEEKRRGTCEDSVDETTIKRPGC